MGELYENSVKQKTFTKKTVWTGKHPTVYRKKIMKAKQIKLEQKEDILIKSKEYAIVMCNLCVRENSSKQSRFLTTLEREVIVFIMAIIDNRAQIMYQNGQIGWCTIFLETEQRFLIQVHPDQILAKELFYSQEEEEIVENNCDEKYMDYEKYVEYENRYENFRGNNRKTGLKNYKLQSKKIRRKFLYADCEEKNKINNGKQKQNRRIKAKKYQMFNFNEHLNSLLALSMGNYCEKDLKTLIKTYENENLSKWGAFITACENNDWRIAKFLIENGSDVNSRLPYRDHYYNNQSDSVLNVASQRGHFQIVKLLLNNKATIGDRDDSLWCASALGHFKIAELLIQNGADVDMSSCRDVSWGSYYSTTSLMIATREGHFQIVKLLVENKANIDLSYGYGWYSETPLWIACKNGHFKIAELLIQNGANVNAKLKDPPSVGDERRPTPSLVACANGHLKILKLLIENGLDVLSDNFGFESLQIAFYNGDFEIAELLIQNGINVNLPKDRLWLEEPIKHAIRIGHFKIVQLLVENGANIDASNYSGLLWSACKNPDLKIIEFLIDNDPRIEYFKPSEDVEKKCVSLIVQKKTKSLIQKSSQIAAKYENDENALGFVLKNQIGQIIKKYKYHDCLWNYVIKSDMVNGSVGALRAQENNTNRILIELFLDWDPYIINVLMEFLKISGTVFYKLLASGLDPR
jgi:ankyrin repeat protein